jgi:FKBP-type peptidyl-prolyl cis-trans isomerase SlpA
MFKIKKTKNMKKVLSDSTVTVNYTGRLEDGTIFDSSMVEGREPMTAKLGEGKLIKGFEEGLVDMSEGDKKTVEIESAEAYGEYLDYLIQEVEKSQMPGEVEVGMPLQAQTEMGVVQFVVKEINEETVVLDANHPLAGKKLIFDLELVSID